MSILDIATEEAERLGAVAVHAIHVRIGPLSGVASEALRSAFELAREDSPFADSRLMVEDVPITAYCEICAAIRPTLSDDDSIRDWLAPHSRCILLGMSKRNVLDRFLDPVGSYLTPEVAKRLVKFRADAETQKRLDELAERHHEGQLSEAEREEYDTYISAIDFITVLQAKARSVLKRPVKP